MSTLPDFADRQVTVTLTGVQWLALIAKINDKNSLNATGRAHCKAAVGGIAAQITADVGHDHDRPVFLLDAQHHAREVMTPEIAKDAIGYLASGYGTDPRVTAWLDAIEIWVVASVNPDGAMYVFDHDRNWRKNRHPGCAVDLNRNYGWNWNACEGSSGASRTRPAS